MKKTVTLLTALVMAACLCAPALADAIVYTTASVNLREGPGLGYAKITALQPGTVQGPTSLLRVHQVSGELCGLVLQVLLVHVMFNVFEFHGYLDL